MNVQWNILVRTQDQFIVTFTMSQALRVQLLTVNFNLNVMET